MNVVTELARDSFWSVVVHVSPRLANVIVFILIGRLAGPAEAGVFALALTYLIVLTQLLRGMDDLVVRQVARDPEQSAQYLTSFMSLRFILAGMLYLMLAAGLRIFDMYTASTLKVILILTLSVIPDGVTFVVQAIKLGKRQFLSPALILFFGAVVKIVSGGLVAAFSHDLVLVALTWLLGSVITTAMQLITVGDILKRVRKSDWWNLALVRQTWRSVTSFAAITILGTVESQADILFLSVFYSETEVGWYNAATTIVFSLSMISQAFRLSIYPLMTRYAQHSAEKLAELYRQSLRYLGMISLPMVCGIALLSTPIVSLLFGDKFLPTSAALRILIWVDVMAFLNVPSVRMMIVHDRQNMVMIMLLAATVLNILLNLFFQPRLGIVGAAWARLASMGVMFWGMYGYVKYRLMPGSLINLLWKTIAATAGMAALVWWFKDQLLLIPVMVGIIGYAGILWLMKGINSADIHLMRKALGLGREE